MVDEVKNTVQYLFSTYYLGIEPIGKVNRYASDIDMENDLFLFLNVYNRPDTPKYDIVKTKKPMPREIFLLLNYIEKSDYWYNRCLTSPLSLEEFQKILLYAKNYDTYYKQKSGNPKLMKHWIVGENRPTFCGDKGIYKLFFEDEVTNRDLAYAYYYVLLLKPDAEEIGFYNFETDKEILYKVKELPEHLIRMVKIRFELTKNKFEKFQLGKPYNSNIKQETSNAKYIETRKKYDCSLLQDAHFVITASYKEVYTETHRTLHIGISGKSDLDVNVDFGMHGWYVIKKEEELLLC